jgi:hypothetical protein
MTFLSYSNPDVLKKYYYENREKQDLSYIEEYLSLCENNKDVQLDENRAFLKNESIVGGQMLFDAIERGKGYSKQNGVASCIFLNENNKLILVPIVYLINMFLRNDYADRSLIHEINHCVEITQRILSDKILLTSGLEQRIFDISAENNEIKLNYSNSNIYTSFAERQFTEFLNDRISYEIYLRLKKKGINILDDNKNFEETKKSERYIDKLENFFKDYEKSIKLSRLYGNIDFLLNSVGVSSINELMSFLYNNYGVESIFTREQIDNFKNDNFKI